MQSKHSSPDPEADEVSAGPGKPGLFIGGRMSKEIQDKIEAAVDEALETGSAEITIIRPDGPNYDSVWGVMTEIKKILPMTPEQEFRVHAMIKRHGHCDKHSMYQKMKWWLNMGFERGRAEIPAHVVWVNDILDGKIKTHKEMSADPDEEICTYDVGSHIYKPKPRQPADSGLN
jgi:hypothetical protein